MNKASQVGCLVVFILVSGCSHIDFGSDGMTYFDPKPYQRKFGVKPTIYI